MNRDEILQTRARRKIKVSIFKLSRLWRQPAARKAKSLECERAEPRGRPERAAEVGHAGGCSRGGSDKRSKVFASRAASLREGARASRSKVNGSPS